MQYFISYVLFGLKRLFLSLTPSLSYGKLRRRATVSAENLLNVGHPFTERDCRFGMSFTFQ